MQTTLALFAAIAAFGSPPRVKLVVIVDGKPVKFEGTQPRTIKGRVMVPLRGVFESIGAYVEYNPVLKRITARRNNEDIEMRVGDKIARKSGAEILMDVPPITVRGRAMVPLRFLAESMGASVGFDKANNTVNIATATDPPPPNDEGGGGSTGG